MTRLNVVGADLARMKEVRAMTDVTGFGLLGHALEMARGAGVIHFAILPEESSNPEDPEIRVRVLAAARRIQSEIQNLGGNFSIPWCPAAWKPAFADLIWGPAPPDLAQLQKLKQVFDARAILSPGRFVGGL